MRFNHFNKLFLDYVLEYIKMAEKKSSVLHLSDKVIGSPRWEASPSECAIGNLDMPIQLNLRVLMV